MKYFICDSTGSVVDNFTDIALARKDLEARPTGYYIQYSPEAAQAHVKTMADRNGPATKKPYPNVKRAPYTVGAAHPSAAQLAKARENSDEKPEDIGNVHPGYTVHGS